MDSTYLLKEFHISEIHNREKKSVYARMILESLPDWFGNKKSIEEYVKGVSDYVERNAERLQRK